MTVDRVSYRRFSHGWGWNPVKDFDEAIAICTRLVEQEGRKELANDLARSLNNRGNALGDLGKLPEAVADYDKAIAIRTRLVEQEGRKELTNDLARTLRNHAEILLRQGKQVQATSDLGKALHLARDPQLRQGIDHLFQATKEGQSERP